MGWGTLYELTLVLSLVAGAIALVLSLLAVEILRRSPFGRVVITLTVVIGLFNLYHLVALLAADLVFVVAVAKSVTLTGVLVFVALTVQMDRQVRSNTEQTGDR